MHQKFSFFDVFRKYSGNGLAGMGQHIMSRVKARKAGYL